MKILKAYGLVIYTTTWWLLLRSSWLWIRRSGVRRKFPWVVSFNDIWWWFVFGVRYLWRHNLTSYSCFQTNVLWKFDDIIGLFFYTHSPYFRKKSSPIHFPYDKVFVKYQAQGGVLTPTPPPCVCPWIRDVLLPELLRAELINKLTATPLHFLCRWWWWDKIRFSTDNIIQYQAEAILVKKQITSLLFAKHVFSKNTYKCMRMYQMMLFTLYLSVLLYEAIGCSVHLRKLLSPLVREA